MKVLQQNMVFFSYTVVMHFILIFDHIIPADKFLLSDGEVIMMHNKLVIHRFIIHCSGEKLIRAKGVYVSQAFLTKVSH